MNGIADLHPSERLRIAHDLHHNIHRLLDKVKRHVALITEEIQQLQDYDLGGRITDLIDYAGKDIIDTAMQHVPDIIRQEGLHNALQHLTKQLQKKYPLDIQTKLHEVNITQELAELIYRLTDDYLTLFMNKKGIQHLTIRLSDNTNFVNLKILRNEVDNRLNQLPYEEDKINRRINSRSKYINAITTQIDKDGLIGIHLLIPKG